MLHIMFCGLLEVVWGCNSTLHQSKVEIIFQFCFVAIFNCFVALRKPVLYCYRIGLVTATGHTARQPMFCKCSTSLWWLWRAHAEHTQEACRPDAYIARAGLFAVGHEEHVAEVIEITHVKENHDEGERVA